MNDIEDQAIRAAIFDCFAKLAPSDDGDPRKIESIAVDADWVALTMSGLPMETRIEAMPTSQRLGMKAKVQRIREVGAAMVTDGLLRRFDVTFANQGKNQRINPYPPGMFMLTYSGCVEVLRRQVEIKEGSK